MYISVSKHCSEFILYLLLLCFINLILCTIIGFWGVLLFLISFILICITLYLFRYYNPCPANLVVSHNILLWPSEGTILSITTGTFFRLTGTIVTIKSDLFNCYTHVSPICGHILKIIYTDKEGQYNNGAYIQIANEKYQVDILIRTSRSIIEENNIPIVFVKEGEAVYASQPLCLSMFGANVKIVIDGELNISTLYQMQNIYAGEVIV